MLYKNMEVEPFAVCLKWYIADGSDRNRKKLLETSKSIPKRFKQNLDQTLASEAFTNSGDSSFDRLLKVNIKLRLLSLFEQIVHDETFDWMENYYQNEKENIQRLP